ncbi:hypothetical protein [Kribbella sp. CA-293567]|uniref:hypothetical protein n=1 Tax=Kribbella sp. CA-293567 TaxID=3002436 RepID=UPI0022DD42E2|nr:hypothetical protein [Kribbella sp. CA-293567]WBQ04944.1 hypothetical protein OX958_33950 [Kribbella sp. CA-293567]
MSDNQLAVEVVRGEMQPWSDYSGKRGAVGGPVLRALLTDVLPAGARTLIVGPHAADLVAVAVEQASSATMLVRSVSDASALAEQFPGLQVIAGALDGLSGPAYEAVVAVDGLDRVLGYDSDDLTWPERLDSLGALCTPETVLVLGLENEFALTSLLDRRPPLDRHGDDEWRPLHDDPARPVSAVQLAAELNRVGLPLQSIYSSFADKTLLAVDVAAAARPGTLPARLATQALESTDIPLLAPIAEAADSASRAGLLASTSSGWLAVTGLPVKHTIYSDAGPAVLTATQTPTASEVGWSIAARVTDTSAGDDAGEVADATPRPSIRGVVYDAAVVPAEVSGGISVETVLHRLAAAEDVPAFRALAARLGEWALAQTGQVVLRWDDIAIDGDSFGFGVSGWTADASRTDLLAAAWQRFHARLIDNHRRHPWPPWMIGDDLVSTWLAMSGVPDAEVASGKEIAGALTAALGTAEIQAPDVRTALADAERARRELFELQGHVFGLERTLGFRDKALKTRETRLRELRLQVQKANAERTRFRNSRAFAVTTLIRKAALIRNPRKFAYKVKRRLQKKLGNRF